MANLIRWNPLDDVQRMRENFYRFFGPDFLFPWSGRDHLESGTWGPSVDVRETKTHIIVHAEIPGVDPKDLDVTITEDALSLRGVVRQEADIEEHGYRRIERRYGSFQRTIPFPVSVKHNEAEANYQNGILKISVPKAEPGVGKAVKLQIRTDQGENNTSRQVH